MRQSDEGTAKDVRRFSRKVKNASRIVQRVISVFKKQKILNTILMNLHPVRFAIAPLRKGLYSQTLLKAYPTLEITPL